MPDGDVRQITHEEILDQMHNAFRMKVLFDGNPGGYKLQATNTGSKKKSNVFVFTAH